MATDINFKKRYNKKEEVSLVDEKSKRIIDIAKENLPIAGCTVSKQLHRQNGNEVYIFSMAEDTGISAESYEYHKIFVVQSGEMTYFEAGGRSVELKENDCIVTATNIPLGVKTTYGCIYTEIGLRKETFMNQVLKAGEVFKLGELLPYQDGKIVNMDLINEDKLKYVIMSFDEGTGLSEHAAPGEALVFALDGEAIIGYEGVDYKIKAGETFKFDKLGKHAITAVTKFKMALLLVLE